MAAARRIHLDPVGGLAGDMFAAALSDAFPELVPGLMAELAKLLALRPIEAGARRGPEPVRLAPHADGALHGLRFIVDVPAPPTPAHDHAHGHAHPLHVPHREIRARLDACGLAPRVLAHALGLFEVLAEAEAQVHGVSVEEVVFHEAGAWDSIVDFVAAAWFVAALEPAQWSCAPLPLGAGTVRTAHGLLPVPTPATALLLRGLAVVDDGIAGERVTPTGAAIARYLAGRGTPPGGPLTVAGIGQGFGSRRLAGAANVLRCLVLAPAQAGREDDEVATLTFEVDDQSAEELAAALDRVRAAPGVLEVYQGVLYGKKGRIATQVQVIARAAHAEAVAETCLAETATLGLRIGRVARRTLAREGVVAQGVRVKLAQRPGGRVSAKAEMDDVARAGPRPARAALRAAAEREALEKRRGRG